MSTGSPMLTRKQAAKKSKSTSDEDDSSDRSASPDRYKQNASNNSRHFLRSAEDSSPSSGLDSSCYSVHKSKTSYSRSHYSSPSSASSATSLSTSSATSSSTPPSPRRLYPDLSGLTESGQNIRSRPSYTSFDSAPSLEVRSHVESRQKHAVKSESKSAEKKGQNLPDPSFDSSKITILCVMVLLISLVFYMVTTSREETPRKVEDVLSGYDFFVSEVKSLQQNFPNQSRSLWKTVASSTRHIFTQPDPNYPSVILLASQSKAAPVLNSCIANKIASVFLKSRGLPVNALSTNVDHLKHLGAADQKLELDKAVNSAFRSSGEKAYVISNLQSLSPEAALLLHSLCDGDNAPFKDVMIVLTLQVENGRVLMSANDMEDYLTRLWTKQLHYDKVTALMSRIANNLVVLLEEDSTVIEQMCH